IDRRHIVEPVEVRDRLQIGLVLDQLLGTAVQEADMGVNALDHLAVEFEHEAKHAMRRRMLRPEVDGEIAGGCGYVVHDSTQMANGEWRVANGLRTSVFHSSAGASE